MQVGAFHGTDKSRIAKREKIEQVRAQRTLDRVPEKFEGRQGIHSLANDGGSGYVIYQVRSGVYFGKRAAQYVPYHS